MSYIKLWSAGRDIILHTTRRLQLQGYLLFMNTEVKTDKDLLDALLLNRQDESVQIEIANRYRLKIYRYIFKHSQNHHIAEEICHDTFIKLYYKLSDQQIETIKYMFAPMLYRMAFQLYINYYKLHPNNPKHNDPLDDANHIANSKNTSEDFLSNATVGQCLENCSTNEASVIYNIYWLNMTYEETAVILSLSIEQVKYIRKKALKRLKPMLLKSGWSLSVGILFAIARDGFAEAAISTPVRWLALKQLGAVEASMLLGTVPVSALVLPAIAKISLPLISLLLAFGFAFSIGLPQCSQKPAESKTESAAQEKVKAIPAVLPKEAEPAVVEGQDEVGMEPIMSGLLSGYSPVVENVVPQFVSSLLNEQIKATIVTPENGSQFLVGSSISFVAEGTGGDTSLPYGYRWNFGNDTTDSGSRVMTSLYNDIGIKKITLLMSDWRGNVGTQDIMIEIVDQIDAPLTVKIIEPKQNSILHLTENFSFVAQVSGGKLPGQVLWSDMENGENFYKAHNIIGSRGLIVTTGLKTITVQAPARDGSTTAYDTVTFNVVE